MSNVLLEKYGLSGHDKLSMTAIMQSTYYVPALEDVAELPWFGEMMAELKALPPPLKSSLFYKPRHVLDTVAEAYVQSAKEYYQCWCKSLSLTPFDAWDPAKIPDPGAHVLQVPNSVPWGPHLLIPAKLDSNAKISYTSNVNGTSVDAYDNTFSRSSSGTAKMEKLPMDKLGLLPLTVEPVDDFAQWLDGLCSGTVYNDVLTYEQSIKIGPDPLGGGPPTGTNVADTAIKSNEVINVATVSLPHVEAVLECQPSGTLAKLFNKLAYVSSAAAVEAEKGYLGAGEYNICKQVPKIEQHPFIKVRQIAVEKAPVNSNDPNYDRIRCVVQVPAMEQRSGAFQVTDSGTALVHFVPGDSGVLSKYRAKYLAKQTPIDVIYPTSQSASGFTPYNILDTNPHTVYTLSDTDKLLNMTFEASTQPGVGPWSWSVTLNGTTIYQSPPVGVGFDGEYQTPQMIKAGPGELVVKIAGPSGSPFQSSSSSHHGTSFPPGGQRQLRVYWTLEKKGSQYHSEPSITTDGTWGMQLGLPGFVLVSSYTLVAPPHGAAQTTPLKSYILEQLPEGRFIDSKLLVCGSLPTNITTLAALQVLAQAPRTGAVTYTYDDVFLSDGTVAQQIQVYDIEDKVYVLLIVGGASKTVVGGNQLGPSIIVDEQGGYHLNPPQDVYPTPVDYRLVYDGSPPAGLSSHALRGSSALDSGTGQEVAPVVGTSYIAQGTKSTSYASEIETCINIRLVAQQAYFYLWVRCDVTRATGIHYNAPVLTSTLKSTEDFNSTYHEEVYIYGIMGSHHPVTPFGSTSDKYTKNSSITGTAVFSLARTLFADYRNNIAVYPAAGFQKYNVVEHPTRGLAVSRWYTPDMRPVDLFSLLKPKDDTTVVIPPLIYGGPRSLFDEPTESEQRNASYYGVSVKADTAPESVLAKALDILGSVGAGMALKVAYTNETTSGFSDYYTPETVSNISPFKQLGLVPTDQLRFPPGNGSYGYTGAASWYEEYLWDPVSAFPVTYTVPAPEGYSWKQSGTPGGLTADDVLTRYSTCAPRIPAPDVLHASIPALVIGGGGMPLGGYTLQGGNTLQNSDPYTARSNWGSQYSRSNTGGITLQAVDSSLSVCGVSAPVAFTCRRVLRYPCAASMYEPGFIQEFDHLAMQVFRVNPLYCPGKYSSTLTSKTYETASPGQVPSTGPTQDPVVPATLDLTYALSGMSGALSRDFSFSQTKTLTPTSSPDPAVSKHLFISTTTQKANYSGNYLGGIEQAALIASYNSPPTGTGKRFTLTHLDTNPVTAGQTWDYIAQQGVTQ